MNTQTEPTRRVKQIIIVRTDLAMPLGKAFSQVSHASMAFISNKIREGMKQSDESGVVTVSLNEAERQWFELKFTKIALAVSSEEELRSLHRQFEEKGIATALIVDDGTTVFGGQPTATCLGVGPAFADEIDPIAGHLKLYK